MPFTKPILRDLVKAAFLSRDLTIFCSDYFPEVHDNFTEGQSRLERISNLLDYAETHKGFQHLAGLVEKENPEKYKEFEERLLAAEDETAGPDRNITEALNRIQEELKINPHYKNLKAKFESIVESIAKLSDYKALHDGLHEIQYGLYHNILASTKIVLDDKYANLELKGYLLTYRREVMKMKDAAKRKKVDLDENVWIAQLEQAGNDLAEGTDKANKAQIDNANQTINQVIGIQPTIVNRKLYQAVYAYNEGLPEPTDLMARVIEKLSAIDSGSEKVKQFQKGIESLRDINTKLGTLIREHNTWQDVDTQMRVLPDLLEAGVPAFNKRWQTLRPRIEPYYEQSGDSGLKDADELLGAAIANNDPGKVKTAFEIYYRVAADRFYYVDKSVLELCDQLSMIRDELE